MDKASESVFKELAQRVLSLLPNNQQIDWSHAHAAVWFQGRWHSYLQRVDYVADTRLRNLLHIDRQKKQLLEPM